MSTYFVLRASNYFVLVLNSLKPFCLSSEQGLMKRLNTKPKEKYSKERLD